MNVVKPKKTVWDKIIRVGAVLGALFLILAAVKGIYSTIADRTLQAEHEVLFKTTIEKKVDDLVRLPTLIDSLNGIIVDMKVTQENLSKQIKIQNRGLSDHLQAEKTNNEYIKWLEAQIDSTKR